jgi:type I restriction enzyme S subunit
MERFIAMEHLEPGSLHVRSWGNVADGTTFTRRCRPGQVLFGKRRAYQRKVAVAEFEAVVSGDIYVLAPKDDRLLPELLPFLCLSERFFQHAVGTSAGSLSPRTNWSSLASFEFDLPPLDQQRRIAEILWVVDEIARARAALHSNLDTLRRSLLVEEFESPQTVSKLASVLDYASDGPFGSKLKTEHYAASGPRVIRLQNIGDGVFNATDEACIAPEYFGELKRYEVRGGDVIVAGLGDETHPVGRAALVPHSLGKAVNKADCFCLRTKPDRMINAYLVSFLNSIPGNKQVRARAQGTTRLRVNVGNLKTVDIPVPALDQQQHFIERLAELDAATAAVGSSIEANHAVRTSVLNQLF